MSEQKKHFYEFGPFRIDVMKRRLFARRKVIRLTPKAFDLLLVLVEERRKDDRKGRVAGQSLAADGG
jgi:DNA-binding response OmpR family regulator